MSSSYVRTEFKSFITTNLPTETLIDLTAEYSTVEEIVEDAGIGRKDPWLGIQFIGSTEETVGLSANNTQGKYREIGSVLLHVVEKVKTTVADDILARSETIRNLLRGQRINDIIIEGVSPPNFESGATLQFDAGYQAASVIVSYQRDLSL